MNKDSDLELTKLCLLNWCFILKCVCVAQMKYIGKRKIHICPDFQRICKWIKKRSDPKPNQKWDVAVEEN